MRLRPAALVAIGVVLLAGLEAVPFYTDWLWFAEVGYVPVFLKTAALRGSLLVGAGLVAYLFLSLNLRAAVWPQFRRNRITRSRGSATASLRRISPVPSVEPSSTTIASNGPVRASRTSTSSR